MKQTLTEGLRAVHHRIEQACQRAGRAPSSIRTMAVSKMRSAPEVRAAYALGLRCFGENYVQELASKALQLGDLEELRWHFIGHLQRNKIKTALQHADSIDSIDSLRLADALCAQLPHDGERRDLWLQVNVAGETQKNGCAIDDAPVICQRLRQHPGLCLRGLMTVPPWCQDPEQNRPHFRRLKQLAASLDLHELSMGMSDDLEVAIEEGATMLRIGTALFGERSASTT